MLEIEQKFRLADAAVVERLLAERGVAFGPVAVEEDHYLNAPDRDFKATGEAFRLRRVGPENCLTFKGKKAPGPVKTRQEIELPLPPGDDIAADYLRLFAALGYRFVAVVRKRRRKAAFTHAGFEVCVSLDEVEGVGSFCEVEVLAEQERSDDARAVVQAVARDLGLHNLEPRSYLGLVLEGKE